MYRGTGLFLLASTLINCTGDNNSSKKQEDIPTASYSDTLKTNNYPQAIKRLNKAVEKWYTCQGGKNYNQDSLNYEKIESRPDGDLLIHNVFYNGKGQPLDGAWLFPSWYIPKDTTETPYPQMSISPLL